MAALLSRIYFKGNPVNYMTALRTAGVLILISLILDVIVTVPVFTGGNYSQYFIDVTLWFGLLLFITVFTFSSGIKKT